MNLKLRAGAVPVSINADTHENQYDVHSVSYHVSLDLTSVPLTVVGLLSLLVGGLSLSLDLRRGEDRVLLWVYRLLVLINAALMGLFFVSANGWLGVITGTRLLLAVVVFLPTTVIAFVRHLHREQPNRGQLGLWVASATMALALAFDSGAFINGQTTAASGQPLPTPGGLFVPLFVAVILATVITFWEVAQRSRGVPEQRKLQISGAALIVFGGLDFINVIVHTGLPPMVWIGSLAVVLAFSGTILREYRDAFRNLEVIERERDDLEQRLTVDELTGLFTRSHGTSVLERALAGGGACVVFIDIDDFKSWNDRYSHATGDHVLREVGRVVRASARSEDAAARYAGDEFFVVLPGARLEAGLRVAEAIRRNLSSITVEGQAITASLGVARGNTKDTAASMLDRADRAAYQAKRDGKNRVSRATVTV